MCGEQPNMARTKQEVIDFLESLVGGGVECKGNPSLNGQCNAHQVFNGVFGSSEPV